MERSKLLRSIGVCGIMLACIWSASAQNAPSFSTISFEVPVLATGNTTSPFGIRKDPFRESVSWHGGIDIQTEWDAPIRAPTMGKIIHVGPQQGYGTMIDLKVSEEWVLRFAHLSAVSVALGDEIMAGEVIGEVGSTGRANGPHLHLEALHDDKQYDPTLLKGLEFYEAALSSD